LNIALGNGSGWKH